MKFSKAFICVATLFVFTEKGNAGVWPNNYTYRGTITVAHIQVPNTDQASFPILVSGTFPELATAANGGHVTNPNGYDIVFSSDANGLQPLKYERESYSATGQVLFWVQVPVLSHATDTTFYVFYGNQYVTTDQATAGGAWDSNYLGVWHLDSSPAAGAPQEKDSTANGHNLTDSGSWFANQSVPGVIGNSILSQFGDYGFTSANNSSLSVSTTMTAEAWININYGGIPTLFEQFDANGLGAGYIIYMNGISNSIRFKLTAGNNGGLPQRTFETIGANVDDGQWHHVVATYTSGTSPIIYVDGKAAAIEAYVNGQLQPSATTVYSGSLNNSAQFQMIPLPIVDYTYPYPGSIDEARLSNVARSADWIATEYNNESNPSGFYTIVWGFTSGGLPPGLAVSRPSLTFSGSTLLNPAPQQLSISNSGGALLTWTAVSATPWLTLSTTSNGAGVSTLSGNGAQTIWLQVNSTAFPGGSYSGSITLTAPGATPGTQTVNVSLTVTVPPGYWQNGYAFQGIITVPHTQVPNSDQTNIPVLVSGSYPALATTANGGKVQTANGYDIIFTSDSQGLNRLNYERESYSANGQVAFWVQVPLLSHSTDTPFYIFYGNPAVSADQSNASGVWDSSYLGVWHLDGNPAGAAPQEPDSTSRAHHLSTLGTPAASSTSGQIGGAVSSTFNSNGFTAVNPATLAPTTAFTLSAWIQINYGGLPSIMNQFSTAGLGAGYNLTMDGTSNQVRLTMSAGSNGGSLQNTFETTSVNVNDGKWHLVTATYASGPGVTFYVDGAPAAASGNTAFTGSVANTSAFMLAPYQSYYYVGNVDETRVANVARSADRVATEYNNQSNPNSFYSMSWNNAPIPTTPVLSVSPLNLTYLGTTITNPVAQQVAIANAGGGTLSWTANSNAPWILLSSTANGAGSSSLSGTGPQTIYVQVTSVGQMTGPYNSSVTISATGSTPASQSVTVGLTVSLPPGLAVAPGMLTYSGTTAVNPAPQSFAISNSGSGTLSWSATSTQSWLTLSATSGGAGSTTLTGNGPQTLYAQVMTTALAVGGPYSASININAPGASPSTQSISVSVTVSTPPPGVAATPLTLTYTGTVSINPAAQSVSITNSGSGTLNWSASSNQSWLKISTTANGAGSATLTGTAPQTIWIQASSVGQSVGQLSGAITISASGATPASQTVSVSLNVTPPPGLAVTPLTLSYTGTTATNPAAQSAGISNTGGGLLSWNATANQSWIQLATSANGSGASTLSGTGAQTIWIQVASIGMPVGSNNGSVTINAAGASPATQTVNVGLTIAPPAAPFLTSAPTTYLRNDYSGFVGMQFTVGATPLMVSQLGRWVAPNSSQTHIVKLVNASTGIDVAGGSVSLNLSGATSGQYAFASLSGSITLLANTSYVLVTQEFVGGDQWYNYGPVTAAAGYGVVNNPVYQSGSSYIPVGASSSSYGPANFMVSTGTSTSSPPTVTVTAPSANTTVSGLTPLTATATASSGLTITSVQFKINGQSVGPVLTSAPYSTNFDTTTLTDGPYSVTATAVDSAANSAPSSPVAFTVHNGSSSSATPFLTGQPSSYLRGDFTGFVGMRFTMGNTALTVSQLGRWVAPNSSQAHIVKLVNATTGLDVSGGSVSLSLAGATASQYAYAPLASAITLAANTSYFLVTQETAGGDQWYNYGPVTPSSAGVVNGPVYQSGGSYIAVGSSSSSYGPANFLIGTGSTGATPPTVSVSAPGAGTTVAGVVSLTATATPAQGATIASVQFQLNGNNVGPLLTSSPYTTTFDTTTLNDGPASLIAVAIDSVGTSGSSPLVAFTVHNGSGAAAAPFLTSSPSSTLRNDYGGYVGMQFTVGNTALNVSQLGRWVAAGSTHAHIVKLVSASTGADVPGGSVTLSLGSATSGQYFYASLQSTITLPANTSYYLVSQEFVGGDQWYNYGPVTITPGEGTVNGLVYQSGTSYFTVGIGAYSYVPVNFLSN